MVTTFRIWLIKHSMLVKTQLEAPRSVGKFITGIAITRLVLGSFLRIDPDRDRS
jgi:hypothetical protein